VLAIGTRHKQPQRSAENEIASTLKPKYEIKMDLVANSQQKSPLFRPNKARSLRHLE